MNKKTKNSGIPWIGEIPESWNVSKVKDAFVRKNVKAHQENPIVLSLARSGVKVRDISNNEGQIAESYFDYNPVDVDDLLINPMDLYSGANCSISKVKGVISPAYVNLRHKENVCPRYYDYYFKTQYWAMAFFAHGKGISFDNRWTLGIDTLFNYYIPSPSYEEQKAIADFLDKKCDEIDKMIAIQEKFIEELKAYKQSVITETVCRGLNPNVPLKDSGVDWIDVTPEHWEVRAIKTMALLKSGDNLTSLDIDENVTLYPVYGGNGVRGYYSQYNHDGDYALIGRQGALCGNVNYGYGKFWATEHCVVCHPKCNFILKWFGESLRAMNLNQYSLSSAQPGISVDRINNVKMLVPPIQEQQEIAYYLDEKCNKIDSLITIKQQKIEELQDYKKSLIYEYATGKKQVI